MECSKKDRVDWTFARQELYKAHCYNLIAQLRCYGRHDDFQQALNLAWRRRGELTNNDNPDLRGDANEHIHFVDYPKCPLSLIENPEINNGNWRFTDENVFHFIDENGEEKEMNLSKIFSAVSLYSVHLSSSQCIKLLHSYFIQYRINSELQSLSLTADRLKFYQTIADQVVNNMTEEENLALLGEVAQSIFIDYVDLSQSLQFQFDFDALLQFYKLLGDFSIQEAEIHGFDPVCQQYVSPPSLQEVSTFHFN